LAAVADALAAASAANAVAAAAKAAASTAAAAATAHHGKLHSSHSIFSRAITPRHGYVTVAVRRRFGGRPWRPLPRWRLQQSQLFWALSVAARRLARAEVTPRRDRRPSPWCGGAGECNFDFDVSRRGRVCYKKRHR